MKKDFNFFNLTSLTFGFAFLYLPILLLIIYSFNESRLVTVWAGFSTKWYVELFKDKAFLDAALITLKLALVSATAATILGTIVSVVMVRITKFRGKTLFSAMVYAPLVMPDVIIGLSLLLLFVSLDISRGFWTISMAHITFSISYAAIVISSRLVQFDASLEEAATDLGCTPFESFMKVTLPIIAPSLLSAWLLTFTLSLDDLVIASFTAGPGSTTLPMKIYSSVRLGVTPKINALSTILITLVAIGVITVSILEKRKNSNSKS